MLNNEGMGISQYKLVLHEITAEFLSCSINTSFKGRGYWEIRRLPRPSWSSASMPVGGAVISKEDGKTGKKCGDTGQCVIRGLYFP